MAGISVKERMDRQWFGNKGLGSIFHPVTAEGSFTLILYVVAIIVAGAKFNFDLSGSSLYNFLSIVLPISLLFILVGYVKRKK